MRPVVPRAGAAGGTAAALSEGVGCVHPIVTELQPERPGAVVRCGHHSAHGRVRGSFAPDSVRFAPRPGGTALSGEGAEPEGGLRFEVHVELSERHAVCRVRGDLDAFTGPQLQHALRRLANGVSLIIDLADVPFIDSAGLRALVMRIRQLRQSGGETAVCCSRPTVNRTLQLTGFDRLVPVVTTREEAIDLLAESQAGRR